MSDAKVTINVPLPEGDISLFDIGLAAANHWAQQGHLHKAAAKDKRTHDRYFEGKPYTPANHLALAGRCDERACWARAWAGDVAEGCNPAGASCR